MGFRTLQRVLLVFGLVFPLAACGPGEESAEQETELETVGDAPATAEPEAPPAGESMDSTTPVVEVVATEYAFEAPDSVPAGWTTFRLRNEGSQHHFLLIYRLPDGKSQSDIQSEVVPVYDRVMAALQNGDMDKAAALEALGNDLPPWFFTVAFMGGPGLIAPGQSADATVNLSEPGNYLMECYVKGPDGRFHSSMGMQKEFTITEGSIGSAPVESDATLRLTNDGIELEGDFQAGRQTVKVDFVDDPPGGFPYDVHVARLADDTDVEELKRWMDWMNVGGMRAPSPVEFVGGAENMASGNSAFFTVDLVPGRYALLSEVGATGNMYREFTVE